MTNNLAIALALEMIGEGFMQLAFALRAPETKGTVVIREFEELKAEEPKAEEPKAEEPKADLQEIGARLIKSGKPKIKLADLQEIGARLIKSGKRSSFLGVLAKHGLKNLSSAPEELYDALHADLVPFDDE